MLPRNSQAIPCGARLWRDAATACCVVVVLALLLSSQRTAAYPMPAEFYELSEELVSKHIAWAKPAFGGPVRILAIAPRGAQRETIELAQRLEMEYEYVLALTPTELGWSATSISYAPADGISNDEMLDELRSKLEQEYDVIIVGHLDWNVFPAELLYRIMKKVHDGAGLVYSYSGFGGGNKWLKQILAVAKPVPGALEEIVRGVPLGALPGFQDVDIANVVGPRSFKQGRIVTLDYGPTSGGKRPRFQYLTPFLPDDNEAYEDAHYEYYMSLVIRSVLWAAGRASGPRIDKWGSDGTSFVRADLDKQVLTATVTAAGGIPELEAETSIRKPDGTVLLTRKQTIGAGSAQELRCPLAVLPSGRYFADLILRRGGKSVAWSTSFFDVDADISVARITTDRPWYEPGQTAEVTVETSAALPSGTKLRVQLVDSLGRLLGEVEPKVKGTSAQCRFELNGLLTITAEVRAILEDKQGEAATAVQSISFVRRQWDDFLFCVWTAGSHFNEQVRRLMFDQLTRAGVDTFTNSSRGEVGVRRAAKLGFWPIPYMTRYSYGGKDTVRKPCLTDPKFLEKHLPGLKETAAVQRPYDPQAYTLGDECFLARPGVDVCFSPSCTADLREWLKGEYDSVGALNASWGTSYKDFGEAEPITLADAKKAKQIPRWVDHRRHMEFVYTRTMKRAKEAIREIDPFARVGFDGPFRTHSTSGDDWARHMEVFDLCNIYFHEPDQWEAVRSFAKPGTLLGLWYGGYSNQRNEEFSRFFPWRTVLHGYNSVWWYAVYHGLVACPMDALTPDMTWYGYFAASVEELREIKGGVGKALMNAERQWDGIAVHYSQSSVHVATAYEGLGNLSSVWRQWYWLLEDTGLQYNCLSYRKIEREGIAAGKYRVLILPCSQAISAKEAQAIKAFARGGGMVLADVRPAVADQHGKLQSPGQLDDLFGIERPDSNLGLTRGVAGKLTTALGRATADTILEKLTVDPSIKTAGASAAGQAGDVPILLTNTYGSGKAVLLNFGLGGYNSCRSRPEAAVYWDVLKGVLAGADVRPRVQVVGPEGPLRKLETVFFKDGAVEYLGFLKYRVDAREQTTAAEVRLDSAAVTYDVRTGQLFGNVDRFQTTFQPDRGKLFARLPYAVCKVTAKPERKRVEAGQEVVLSLALEAESEATPGRHWFRVEVSDPEGHAVLHYARNAAVGGGTGQARIPLALSDPRGKWQVTVRDIASGLTAETTFTVR